MSISPNLKALFEEELEQLVRVRSVHPLLDDVSFDREDYFFNAEDKPRRYEAPTRKAELSTQSKTYTHFIETSLDNSQFKEELANCIRIEDIPLREATIKKWIHRHIIQHIPFRNENGSVSYSDEVVDILGKYLGFITRGQCTKLVHQEYPETKDPRLFKGRIVEIDPATSTLSYYINDQAVIALGGKRPQWSEKIGKPENELTQAEAHWNLALQFPCDSELQIEHSHMVLQEVFPNHHLNEVIAELKDPNSFLHNLTPEELFLVITRPKLAGYGIQKKDDKENQKKEGKDLSLPWSSCNEVREKLVTHVLQRAFRDRIVEVTAFHPEHVKTPQELRRRRSNLRKTAEEECAAGQKLHEYSQRGFWIKPFVKKPVLTTDEEQALEEDLNLDPVIGNLHKTLLAIEECFSCAKDMERIAGKDNADWMSSSQQYIALGRCFLRALPDYIRQIEYSLLHPKVRIEIEAVAGMIDSLLLNDFGEVPDISKKLADLHSRGEAVREVLALTESAK